MKPKSEFDVHDIIKCYPYFLGEKFTGMKLTHERIYPDRTRADFAFSNCEKVVVVEVKKDVIDLSMLNQAIGYLDNEKIQNPQKDLEGMLVGLPSDDSNLKEKIDKSRYRILERFIGIHVPSNAGQIKICSEGSCRKANWYYKSFCEYCGSQEFIKDPFTFLKRA